MAYKNLRFGSRIVVFALALLIFLFFISFYFILDRTPATATTETSLAVSGNLYNTDGSLNGSNVAAFLNKLQYDSITTSTTLTSPQIADRAGVSTNSFIFQMGYYVSPIGAMDTSKPLTWQATYLRNGYLTIWLTQSYTVEYFNNGSSSSSGWKTSSTNYGTNGNYSNSILREVTRNIYTQLSGELSSFSSIVASPSTAANNWQNSQPNVRWASSGWWGCDNGLGTNIGPHTWTWNNCMGDMFWIPSYYEVNNTSTTSSSSYTNGLWGMSQTDIVSSSSTIDGKSNSNTWLRSGLNLSNENTYSNYALLFSTSNSVSGPETDTSAGVRPACHIDLDNLTYVITVKSSNESQGTVSGGGTYVGTNNTTTVTAIPRSGYVFDYWLDSSGIKYTRNPLTIAVTKDETYTAYFTEGVDITVQTSDSSLGSVSGGGAYALGRDVTISATPVAGVTFSHWLTNTGVKYYNNPLVLPANENITYTAYFIRNYVTVSTSNSGAEIESTSIGTTSTTTTHNLLFTTGNYISGITVNYGVEYPITAINGTLAVNDKSCTAIDFRTNPEGSMLYLAVYGARADVNIMLHFVNVAQSYSPASGGANIEGVALQVSGGIGNSLEAVGEARITGYTTTDSLTTVHVSAVASKGYYFVGWETNDNTDLSQYGSTADIPYDLIEGKILTAVFASTANSQTNGTTNNTGPEFG